MATKLNRSSIYKQLKPKQRRAAEMLVDPEFNDSITKLCETLNIARSTFYRWQDDTNFNGYLNWLIDHYTDAELANVWKATIRSAISGDAKAQKLYFELKGKYKQNIDINADAVVILDDIPDSDGN